MITTGTIYVIQARTTITGPNNTHRVVWALGEYFIKIYSCFTKILILFNRLFNKFQDEGTQTMRTCRLGPRLEPRYYYPPPPLPPPTPFRTRHRITTHTNATTTTPKSPTGPEQRFLPLFMPNKYFFRIYIYRFRYIYRHRYIYR